MQAEIKVETMYHRPDGRCSYTVTIPCSVVEAQTREYDYFDTIRALLEVRGLIPDPQWHSMHDIPNRVWRIWGTATLEALTGSEG